MPLAQKPEKSLKKEILLPLSIAFFALAMIILGGAKQYFTWMFEEAVDQKVSQIKEFYQASLELHVQKLAAGLRFIQHNPKLLEYWQQQDRLALQKQSVELFAELKKNYNVTHFYFHQTDGRNFLRVHHPQRFSDEINRITMHDAMQNTRLSYGVELGPLGTLTLRAVEPIYLQGQLLGYVEFGEEIDYITEQIKQLFDVDIWILLEKDYLASKGWVPGMSMLGQKVDWNLLPHHVASTGTTEGIPPVLQVELRKLGQGIHSEELDFDLEDGKHKAQTITFDDAAQQHMGDFLILMNINDESVYFNYSLLGLVGGVSLLFVLLVILFYRITSKAEGKLEYTQKALLDHQQHLNRLVDERTSTLERAEAVAQVGSWHLDFVGNKLTWSDQTYKIFETDPSTQVSLEYFISCIHPDDVDFVMAAWNACMEGETYDIKHRIVTKTGTKWVHERAKISFDKRGLPLSVDGAIQNITTQQSALESAREAKRAAEMATQSKSEFLANMSHEIRTPMNAIIGMSHLAMQANPNPKQRNYLEKVLISAEGLLGIINDILDFSKIESGKLDIEKTDFRLEDVIENVTNLIGLKCEEKSLQLCFDIDPVVPTALFGDSLRLSQILINLSNNAVKFTDEGGKISIGAAVEEENSETALLHFWVKDTGIGISQEQQEKLFQPFSQADASITRQYGGSGLGLAISTRLVGLMDGKIWLDSEYGIGSTFHFSVLMSKQQGTPAARLPSVNDLLDMAQKSINRLRGARILLVEDNEINQELAQELLTRHGLIVEVVNNGQEAVDCLQRGKFDGVLMDCQMPVMDGYTATQILRKMPCFAKLPIIAMTANVMAGDREKVLTAGMNDHIAKPFNVNDMFNIMAKWITPGESFDVMEGTVASESPKQKSPDPDDEIFDLPGIDAKKGLACVGGKSSFYRKMLIKFLGRYEDFEQQFREAQKAEDPQEAMRAAHTLKSVAGSVGAMDLYEAAQLMEAACNEDAENIDEILEDLVSKLQIVINGVSELVADTK